MKTRCSELQNDRDAISGWKFIRKLLKEDGSLAVPGLAGV